MTESSYDTLVSALREASENERHLDRRMIDTTSGNVSWVILRQFAPDGGFLQTVKCLPGVITVVPSVGSDSGESFRLALLSADCSSSMQMRYGYRDLHPSEIHRVGTAEYLWSRRSLAEVVRAAGAAQSSYLSILDAVGLREAADRSPRELNNAGMKRLAIVTSFFSKSRLIHYDEPFLGSGPNSTEALAELMLEAVRKNRQIMLVTGVDYVPEAWRESELVHVEHEEAHEFRNDQFPGLREVYSEKIKDLISDTRGVCEEIALITRPQLIHRDHCAAPVKLQAEAICNPRWSGSNSWGIIKENGTANGFHSRRRRKNTGTLTRVTKIHRIRRMKYLFRLFELKYRFTQWLKARRAALN